MYVKNVKTVSGGSVGRACQYDHIVKMYHIFSVSPVGGGMNWMRGYATCIQEAL